MRDAFIAGAGPFPFGMAPVRSPEEAGRRASPAAAADARGAFDAIDEVRRDGAGPRGIAA